MILKNFEFNIRCALVERGCQFSVCAAPAPLLVPLWTYPVYIVMDNREVLELIILKQNSSIVKEFVQLMFTTLKEEVSTVKKMTEEFKQRFRIHSI